MANLKVFMDNGFLKSHCHIRYFDEIKRMFVLAIIFLAFQNTYSQVTQSPIKLYQTTRDFIKGTVWEVDAIALIVNESEHHIQIEKIIDSETKKTIKRGTSAWATEYKSEKYFNLGYSGDLNRWGYYIKFDIIGRYSVIIIDDTIPFNTKTDTRYYGAGLNDVLIGESNKWGKKWENNNDEKKKILFMDLHDLDRKSHFSHNAQCTTANYLTRNKLKEIMGEKFPDIDGKDVSFDQAMEIINSLNESLKF